MLNAIEQLKLSILRVLDQCRGIVMRDSDLLMQVRLSTNPPPTASEFRSAINDLDCQGFIVGVRGGLSNEACWCIAPSGKAILAQYP